MRLTPEECGSVSASFLLPARVQFGRLGGGPDMVPALCLDHRDGVTVLVDGDEDDIGLGHLDDLVEIVPAPWTFTPAQSTAL